MAVSRPEPGPFTKTSTLRIPCSIALRAAFSAAICAAKGVDLREPLNPTCPALAHEITAPLGSQIDTIVLLNVLLMCAWPCAMFFFSLRRTFLAPAPARFCGGIYVSSSLLLAGLLLAGDSAARPLAGTGVGVGALTVHREAATVPDALVGTDLDLAADVLGDLTAEVTFDAVVGVDPVAQAADLLVGEVTDAGVGVDPGLLQRLTGSRTADAEDVGQRDLAPLLAGEVDAGKACHGRTGSSNFSEVVAHTLPACPGRSCAWRGPGLRPGVTGPRSGWCALWWCCPAEYCWCSCSY